jgi:hypothetical protein
MSNLPPPHRIYLQFSGNYDNSSLRPFGMPSGGIEFSEIGLNAWDSPIGGEISIKNKIISFIKRKFEVFNIEVITDQSVFNNTPTSRRSRIIFLPIENSFTDASLFYIKLKQKLLVQKIEAIAFRPIQTGFVFIRDRDQFDQYGITNLSIDGIEDYAVAIIGQLFGIPLSNVSAIGTGRFRWSALNRLKVLDNSLAFSKQWFKNSANPINLMGSRFGYIKTPPPNNIANKSEYGDSLVLTKQRHITRRQFSLLDEIDVAPPGPQQVTDSTSPGYLRARDYVITGMIGHHGDEDILKILLRKGDYKFMHIHLRNSMLDVRLELLVPQREIPKDKNKLNTTLIKNECANKIQIYPRYAPAECFGFDKIYTPSSVYKQANHELWYSIIEDPKQEPATIEFSLRHTTFVYIRVSASSGGSPWQGSDQNYSSLGKYAIAMIDGDIKNVSHDYKYPSCYLNFAPDPDPTALPERKLSRFSFLQNGKRMELGVYLQEKDDNNEGALIVTRKLNTVINGKLIREDQPDAIKYIVDAMEYKAIAAPALDPDKASFYFFVNSKKPEGGAAVLGFYTGAVVYPDE